MNPLGLTLRVVQKSESGQRQFKNAEQDGWTRTEKTAPLRSAVSPAGDAGRWAC